MSAVMTMRCNHSKVDLNLVLSMLLSCQISTIYVAASVPYVAASVYRTLEFTDPSNVVVIAPANLRITMRCSSHISPGAVSPYLITLTRAICGAHLVVNLKSITAVNAQGSAEQHLPSG